MKNFLLSLLTLALLLSACAPVEEPMSDSGYAQPTQPDTAHELNPNVKPDQLQALADGNTAFAVDFYHQIRSSDGNLVYSPLSLSLALSMTLSGARGETRDEMLQALSLTILGDDLHPAFDALMRAIKASEKADLEGSAGSKFQLNLINAIWPQIGEHFEQDFLDGLAEHYGAGVNPVDYVNQLTTARKEINDWVAQQTEDKIQDLIPDDVLSTATRLVLTNAIYFNGSWAYPFLRDATQPAPFTLLDGSQVQATMMTLPSGQLGYYQGEAFQAVSLPYLSRDFAMVLIVPDEGQFTNFEQSLSSEALQSTLSSLETQSLNLQMPKFDIETPVDAVLPLQNLGMLSAFGPADFSGMTGTKELFISDVVHKATITVDEQGTEAAAATAVVMDKSMPMQLVIDRPFLFTIVHQPTGSILFMGRVLQP